MLKSSMKGRRRGLDAPPARARARCATLLVAPLLLAACTGVEVQNTQPAQEIADKARPPGEVYTGWRVFQDKCARCHGPSATGTEQAPDLLPRVRAMGERRFTGLVLVRYDWNLPPAEMRDRGAAFEALVESVVQRKEGAIAMPAWQGEPRVNAHIADLYAYLAARAEGTQGPGRPTP